MASYDRLLTSPGETLTSLPWRSPPDSDRPPVWDLRGRAQRARGHRRTRTNRRQGTRPGVVVQERQSTTGIHWMVCMIVMNCW